MTLKQISNSIFQIGFGAVNAFIVNAPQPVLIDSGYEGSEERILAELAGLGFQPADLRHIVMTHAHPDHAGSLKALVDASGAQVYAHPRDAALLRGEFEARPFSAPPAFFQKMLFKQVIGKRMEGVTSVNFETVDAVTEINDGDYVPGGLRAIHVPGHSAGQLAFLHEAESVLIAADVCMHIFGLDYSIGYEDLATGLGSLARLAELRFEKAVFGHGRPITKNASAAFKKRWR